MAWLHFWEYKAYNSSTNICVWLFLDSLECSMRYVYNSSAN